jgi:hypothetical protein
MSIMQHQHQAASALRCVPQLHLSTFLCSLCRTRSLRHLWSHPHAVVQIAEAERSMDIKLRYTGEDFVDVKAW